MTQKFIRYIKDQLNAKVNKPVNFCAGKDKGVPFLTVSAKSAPTTKIWLGEGGSWSRVQNVIERCVRRMT